MHFKDNETRKARISKALRRRALLKNPYYKNNILPPPHHHHHRSSFSCSSSSILVSSLGGSDQKKEDTTTSTTNTINDNNTNEPTRTEAEIIHTKIFHRDLNDVEEEENGIRDADVVQSLEYDDDAAQREELADVRRLDKSTPLFANSKYTVEDARRDIKRCFRRRNASRALKKEFLAVFNELFFSKEEEAAASQLQQQPTTNTTV
eukprot:scaffold4877_cov171-Ochromonas_danica.AAC.18